MRCSFTCFDYFNPAAIPTLLLLSTVVSISHSLDRFLHCQRENNIYDVARSLKNKMGKDNFTKLNYSRWERRMYNCTSYNGRVFITDETFTFYKLYFIFAYTSINVTFHLMQWIMQIIVNDIMRNDFSKNIMRIWIVSTASKWLRRWKSRWRCLKLHRVCVIRIVYFTKYTWYQWDRNIIRTIDSKTIAVPLFYLVGKIEQILIYFLHWIISSLSLWSYHYRRV